MFWTLNHGGSNERMAGVVKNELDNYLGIIGDIYRGRTDVVFCNFAIVRTRKTAL